MALHPSITQSVTEDGILVHRFTQMSAALMDGWYDWLMGHLATIGHDEALYAVIDLRHVPPTPPMSIMKGAMRVVRYQQAHKGNQHRINLVLLTPPNAFTAIARAVRNLIGQRSEATFLGTANNDDTAVATALAQLRAQRAAALTPQP